MRFKVCPECHVALLKHDVWYKPKWLTCEFCGYHEPREVKEHRPCQGTCESCQCIQDESSEDQTSKS